jgi:lysophospholipase L1-like esterase
VLPSWHLVLKANRTYTPRNSDFIYPYSTNKFGIREREFERSKKDSGIRIFVTGDSFAEGQGAPYDSTWPHRLAKYLANDGINAEVLNTGVAGSDPVYNYVLHRDVLKDYKADYIIVPINASDFSDYMMRGGFERFHPDGTTHFKKGPWYEPLYHHFFFARGVIEKFGHFPFRGIFATEQDICASADNAIVCYSSVVDSFVNLVKPDSTKVIVLLFATPNDIRFESNEINKFRQCFIALQQQLAKKDIACINIWDDLKTDLKNRNYLLYGYPNDGHFKPYGYDLMARLIERNLIEKGLITGKQDAY